MSTVLVEGAWHFLISLYRLAKLFAGIEQFVEMHKN